MNSLRTYLAIVGLIFAASGVDAQEPEILLCQAIPGENKAELGWLNVAPYDLIQISVDGVIVATLPGTEEFFVVEPLSAGVHALCIHAYEGPNNPLPDVCCEVDVDGNGNGGNQPPPLTQLACDLIAGTNNVALAWTNPGGYGGIQITVNGAFHASLPGTASFYTVTGLAPGNHVICVEPFDASGALIPPPACCDVFIGGPPPIIDLSCDVLASTAGVQLVWGNPGGYSAIKIEVNGAIVANLPGSATSYMLTGLAPGGYVVCVIPCVGTTPILPPACCQFSIAAVEPIEEISCDPIAGTNNVAIAWLNMDNYDEIKIEVDGVIIDTIPGTDQFYMVTGLAPGGHVVCVIPCVGGAQILPAPCCQFGIAAVEPIEEISCDPIAGTNNVAIAWLNMDNYDEIKIEVDGVIIDTIPGTDQFYMVTGLAPGGHVVCVIPCVGGAQILPAPCCQFGQANAQPIATLICDPIDPDGVAIAWTNAGVYDSIEVFLDGALVAVLPGSAEFWQTFGIAPGLHTICVQAVIGGVPLTPPACCEFELSAPIANLFCDVVNGTGEVHLVWTNAAPYTSIEIEVNGTVVATLPGTATSYLLTGLAPGGYVVCVVPFVGPNPVLPPACCQFSIAATMPITGLLCDHLFGTDQVQLVWTNGGLYTSIEIELDGIVVATLPGTATSYLLTGVPGGGHAVCVRPFVGTTLVGPPACCQFFIPIVPTFIRGDFNADGLYDISDAIGLLTYLFTGGVVLCDDAADANDDGLINVADGIYILNSLFGAGPLPPAPHPACGPDPTADALGCASFPPCP